MTNDSEKMVNPSQTLLILILIWLGILSGVIITMLLMQRVQPADVKSDVLGTPTIQYVVPSSYLQNIAKPGPDPWIPITIPTTLNR